MKKILTLFPSLFIFSESSLITAACAQESVLFLSAEVTTNTTNVLFEDFESGDILSPVTFKYLKYSKGGWEHFGFDSFVDSLKISKPYIKYESLNSNDISFFDDLLGSFSGIKKSDGYDFTGLSFDVINTFVNKIKITADDIFADSTMTIVIKHGWEAKVNSLLNLKSDPGFFKNRLFNFINPIINNTISYANIINSNKTNVFDIEVTNLNIDIKKLEYEINNGDLNNVFNIKSIINEINFEDDNKSFEIEALGKKAIYNIKLV